MIRLVILRHGESIWNEKNLFTGWTDVDLSEKGIDESKCAGKILKKEGFVFDIAFTSVLKRGIRTMWIVLDEMDLMWIPVRKSWRLNERHYGALQGLNKRETAKKQGMEIVHIWRRSYDVKPPALNKTDKRHVRNDPMYKNLNENELPCTESLDDTVKRVLPYWQKRIVPEIRKQKTVFISAHGNSLRALVKHLDGISNEDIINLNIPTGIPLVYEFSNDLKQTNSYYIGGTKRVKKAIQSVEKQGMIR